MTSAEIQASGYNDALAVVQALRPLWLNTRGSTTFGHQPTVKIYLDGSLLGEPATLAQIPVASIGTIRFMDGLEATNRWGLDHGSGAILVSTRPD